MSAACEGRRYCFAACRDPWFNECADCWIDGGNPVLWPAGNPAQLYCPDCGAALELGHECAAGDPE